MALFFIAPKTLFHWLVSATLLAFCCGFSPYDIRGGVFAGHQMKNHYRRSFAMLAKTSTEEAAAITDFMAKAHEEKIRAMAQVEAKYKDQIAELQAKINDLEGPQTGSEATGSNSYAFPATNKLLTEKVSAYQTFISDYIVKASIEKQKAVQAAEDKLTTKYEAIIANLKNPL